MGQKGSSAVRSAPDPAERWDAPTLVRKLSAIPRPRHCLGIPSFQCGADNMGGGLVGIRISRPPPTAPNLGGDKG